MEKFNWSSYVSLDTLESAVVVIALTAPGFLISYFRSRFITGRTASLAVFGAEYVMLSVVYYAATVPIFVWLDKFSGLSFLTLFFFLPMLVGVLLGILHQLALLDRCLSLLASWCPKCRFVITHPAPTSWDYAFGGRTEGCWVVVTLRNYEQVFGYFGSDSFASSELESRDLFIEEVRDANWNSNEADGQRRGVWINEDEIAMVEMIT